MSTDEHVDLRNTEPTEAGGYGDAQAAAGIDAELPEIDTFPSHFDEYTITIENPEYSSICPKTGLPDYGLITITYSPGELCLELKSLKLYFHSFRNRGVFHEAVTNEILDHLVKSCRPRRLRVVGDFRVRGGLSTVVTAEHPEPGTSPRSEPESGGTG